MKMKFAFLTPVVLVIAIFACKKPLKGAWSDNIHLSGKDFSFNSAGDSVLVTAKGKWWAVNGVTLDTTRINVYSSANDACNFIYTDSNIRIASKNCDTLFIKMYANKTTAERTVSIGLSAGDYFDGIKIVQQKK